MGIDCISTNISRLIVESVRKLAKNENLKVKIQIYDSDYDANDVPF